MFVAFLSISGSRMQDRVIVGFGLFMVFVDYKKNTVNHFKYENQLLLNGGMKTWGEIKVVVSVGGETDWGLVGVNSVGGGEVFWGLVKVCVCGLRKWTDKNWDDENACGLVKTAVSSFLHWLFQNSCWYFWFFLQIQSRNFTDSLWSIWRFERVRSHSHQYPNMIRLLEFAGPVFVHVNIISLFNWVSEKIMLKNYGTHEPRLLLLQKEEARQNEVN